MKNMNISNRGEFNKYSFYCMFMCVWSDVIYALKNDSIYKIVSHFDGKKGDRKKKLVRGMQFQATLISQFGNIISPCNLMLDFHGVAIGLEYKKRHILDLWLCEELNGPYLTK